MLLFSNPVLGAVALAHPHLFFVYVLFLVVDSGLSVCPRCWRALRSDTPRSSELFIRAGNLMIVGRVSSKER